ncbi:MAG TPA: polysaccharide pyruvyl transferase family protein, partial [Sphingobacteriaceae bacterium]|nr:polysaccharide pyruvyl transferase family protein [Sphingobacteriaceae bacterium]
PNITEPITNNSGMKELNSMGFDGYVVGSDQCWRPKYSPQIANYFLDFASNEQEIKRISYAASFGVSNWEFNEEDTFLCSKFAQKFNAISVREDSGVNLVKKYLKQEAVHVLDPTMLLDTGDYVRITENEKAVLSAGELKVYILDRSLKKGNIVEVLERRLGLRKFEVLPKKRFGIDKYDNIEDFIYPGPVQWLQGYRDAKFVITDSFHGTVFSILFNVPFLVIPNSSRGVARFESLLKVFGLEDRLINNIDDFDTEKVIDSAIDWEMVNEKLAQERTKAIQFLNVNLS